ncbi:MAG TPA: DMT family transporter, partial [Alphaproteobacteria bacterium]|nr:DMT family transporter [Alphaproteobacteria bacterium]
TGLFAAMSALIKYVSDTYPTGQVVFSRSLFALVPVFLLIRWNGGLKALKTTRPGAHLIRSGSGFVAMLLSFGALSLLPLADAIALGFLAPLLTTAFAALLLKEKVRVYRWSAIVVGFGGMLLMVQPQGEIGGTLVLGVLPLGVALALSATVFTALAMISIRRMTNTEPSITIVFYFTLTCTIFAGLTLPFAFVMPGPRDAVYLIMIGLLGGFAQVLLTSSYRLAPASTLAPFDYTALLWGLLIGYFVFAEVPEVMVLVGAGVVTASGIFIILRERALGLERARARRAGGNLSPPAS